MLVPTCDQVTQEARTQDTYVLESLISYRVHVIANALSAWSLERCECIWNVLFHFGPPQGGGLTCFSWKLKNDVRTCECKWTQMHLWFWTTPRRWSGMFGCKLYSSKTVIQNYVAKWCMNNSVCMIVLQKYLTWVCCCWEAGFRAVVVACVYAV